ncbi:hypothetical protein K9L05_01595 [Candidatus Babeliales bacterium]|nr:hypothetical protein [Candidatus Babeliales bacterium]MCF7899325.1 hypothetical protein [Candidatus Babeliales bacterium]
MKKMKKILTIIFGISLSLCSTSYAMQDLSELYKELNQAEADSGVDVTNPEIDADIEAFRNAVTDLTDPQASERAKTYVSQEIAKKDKAINTIVAIRMHEGLIRANNARIASLRLQFQASTERQRELEQQYEREILDPLITNLKNKINDSTLSKNTKTRLEKDIIDTNRSNITTQQKLNILQEKLRDLLVLTQQINTN